jgi:site-specific DNA recombinase
MDQNNIQTSPLRVAFYLRVSSEDQAEKYGIPMQREALMGLVQARSRFKGEKESSMTLAGDNYIYVDEGISGTLPVDERPAFARLKDDIIRTPENRPFDVVMVYKLDRFARRLKILLNIVDLFDNCGVKFISAMENIDTSTPFGRAMMGIVGVIAELELETIKARMEGGKEEARKRGVFIGTAPFGYIKDQDFKLIATEEESKVVEMIFQLFTIQKMSPQSIASYLINCKHLSPEASAMALKKRKKGEVKKKNDSCFWRADKVKKILSDEVYIGKFYYHKNENGKKLSPDKWELSPHKHEAIIDLVTFDKAKRILKSMDKFRPKSVNFNHVYTLSGLLRCDACKGEEGKMMNWVGSRKEIEKGSGKFTYSYQCGRKNITKNSHICPTIPFPAHEIENYILDFIKKLLSNPETVYGYQQNLKSTKLETALLEKQRIRLQDLIEGLPARRKNILDQHTSGYINKNELDLAMNKLRVDELDYKKRLEETERKQSETSLSGNYIKVFDEFKEKYINSTDETFKDREETSRLLHMMIEDIIVYSRPVDSKDKIAGRRKKGQLIPCRIDIKFRLPQELLDDLIKAKGGEVRGDFFRSESRTGVEPI